AAAGHGWTRDSIVIDDKDPVPGVAFIAYNRLSSAPRRNVYLSSGIHGDEPAGPLAMRQLLQENTWPADISFWICPCLNPTGFPINRRENSGGIDLNRDYRHLQSAEVRAHSQWL